MKLASILVACTGWGARAQTPVSSSFTIAVTPQEQAASFQANPAAISAIAKTLAAGLGVSPSAVTNIVMTMPTVCTTTTTATTTTVTTTTTTTTSTVLTQAQLDALRNNAPALAAYLAWIATSTTTLSTTTTTLPTTTTTVLTTVSPCNHILVSFKVLCPRIAAMAASSIGPAILSNLGTGRRLATYTSCTAITGVNVPASEACTTTFRKATGSMTNPAAAKALAFKNKITLWDGEADTTSSALPSHVVGFAAGAISASLVFLVWTRSQRRVHVAGLLDNEDDA